MVNVDPFMECESSQQEFIDRLFCPEPLTCLEAVKHLKNSVIGSNKQKGVVIQLGVLPRLFALLLDKNSSPELTVEVAVTLGSLAKGSDKHVESLLEAGLINVVLRGLLSPHPKLTEACLRCLRTVLSRKDAPIDVLYDDQTLVPGLVQLAQQNSTTVQECVMTMLYSACQTADHQDILCDNYVLELLTPLLNCNIYKIQIPSLRCLAQMCYQNEKVSHLAALSSHNGKSIPDILVSLMCRDKNTEMQLIAAKCMTYLCRSGALESNDPRIVYKALPTLVRMCQKDVTPTERVEGAETLAYLTEVDTELQRIASISDHLIPTLSELLKYRARCDPIEDSCYNEISKKDTVIRVVEEVKMAEEMKQAAFKAFASLAANDEDIRRKIIDTDGLMDCIVSALSDPNPRVRLSSVRCLHSLSRSVQQLRTTFQDHAVWRPLMKLIHNAEEDLLVIASSTLCNLLLEFSPSKEQFLESGIIDLFCGMTRKEDPSLRLNGVWGLMNMAFQADHKIKHQILTSLGPEHVFSLLEDTDVNVLMKTLGLLRNLLSTKPVGCSTPYIACQDPTKDSFYSKHIDHIMGLHGKQVIQRISQIMDGELDDDVKEQAICILANVSDGDFAKNFIMSNEEVLKKLTAFMMDSNIKLQIASTFCVSNLLWKEEDGAMERQARLKELGVQQILQQLLSTSDTSLFDRVKTALHQFPASPSS